MRCKKCGREISSKDLFCTGCGAKQTPKKKSHKGILILVVFVMLAIAVIGGIWCVKQLLSNTKHEQEREEVSSADGNLWEELDNDLDADEKEEKKEEEKEDSEKEEEKEESSEEKSSEEKEAEPFERGRIDPAGEKYFFLTQSDVMEIFGEPDVEYEKEGDYAGKHIEYGEIGITFAEGEEGTILSLYGPFNQIIEGGDEAYKTIDDVKEIFDAGNAMRYRVYDGVGDSTRERNDLVAISYTSPYAFSMVYNPDRTIDPSAEIAIVYSPETGTGYFEDRITGSMVETYVGYVRDQYNAIVKNCNEDNAVEKEAAIDDVLCKVTAYIRDDGEIMCISYTRKGDTYWYYFNDVALCFLYMEKKDGSAQRWYFEDDMAFRIRVADDSDKPGNSRNYEDEDLIAYMDSCELIDINYIEKGVYLRTLFE